MEKKIVIFASPTCGPCQLFKPQLKKATSELNIMYEEIDVTTTEGAEKAAKFGIRSSGQAIYFEDKKEKFRWTSPCSANTIKNDVLNVK